MRHRTHACDVVVVGARAAGAATAMLLARQGLRVLLVDRDRPGRDRLSTHALMRGGVFLLSRWGLLSRVIDAGTPPVRRIRFDYGHDEVNIAMKPSPGVEALYAPRRTVLDPILADAAAEAGAQVRFGVTVSGLLRDTAGRVIGVHGHDRAGATMTAHARLVVGADGVRSTVAREAGSAFLRTGSAAGAVIYGYWSDLPVDGYEWFYRPGHSAGIIPTNHGQACVFAGVPADRLAVAGRGGLDAAYHSLLAAAGADRRLAGAAAPRRLYTWAGQPSYIRQAHGPGWVLAGDAGSFLDPLSTHGLTDAFRDAEILTQCDPDRFAGLRDKAITPIFDAVEKIAGYAWDLDELRGHLLELSAAMNSEAELIAGVP